MITMNSLSEQLDCWYQQELGRCLVAAEKHALDNVIKNLFGYYIVQINGPNVVNFLSASPILNKVRMDEEMSAGFRGWQVRATRHNLPLVPKSVDVIVLPHVLEFSSTPHEILKNTYQSLVLGGRVVILGFNPISLWGVMKNWRNHLPSDFNWMRQGKLIRLLSRLGFGIEHTETTFYRPAFLSEKNLDRSLFMEAIGPLCWSNAGAVYIIVAQKVKSAVTFIQAPAFKRRKIFAKSSIPSATSRSIDRVS